MNMLNIEMRAYQSFDADGRNAIVGIVKSDQAEQLDSNGDWVDKKYGTVDKNGVYRLKLKEGAWYTFWNKHEDKKTVQFSFKATGIGNYKISNNNFHQEIGRLYFEINDIIIFRPATKEEIEAIKPCFKRGDVVFFGDWIARVDIIKEGNYDTLSRMSDEKSLCFDMKFVFDKSHDVKSASLDQIKQLEIEEMKHGKSWNKHQLKYDDYLLPDGISIVEFMKN